MRTNLHFLQLQKQSIFVYKDMFFNLRLYGSNNVRLLNPDMSTEQKAQLEFLARQLTIQQTTPEGRL